MDPMFGTKNVKYHIFTLNVFDFHHKKVLVVWVIVSWQICEDSVEWLSAMRAKLLLHMPHFIVNDAPQNSKHYDRLYIYFLIFCCIVLCFGTTLARGFHNIFIVHGKHTNVGCTMAGLCGVEIMSQFFFAHGMC
jgi:hypothetical protein